MNLPGLIRAMLFLVWSCVMSYYMIQFSALTNHRYGRSFTHKLSWVCPLCREYKKNRKEDQHG